MTDSTATASSRAPPAPRADASPSATTAPARSTTSRSPTAPSRPPTSARSRPTTTRPGSPSTTPASSTPPRAAASVTFIDGDKGILEYRGYPIEQLAEKSNFLEVAYLLIHGELPTKEQYDAWVHEITYHTFVHENVQSFMEGFRYDAHPMGMLMASVGALSTFYPESRNISDADNRHMQIVRMIAKMPTLGAWAFRHAQGKPYVYPDNDLGYTANFLVDAVQDERAEVRGRRAAGQGPRRAVHPARRPRAELLDQRGPLGRLLAGRPLLRGRRRHRRALRPAARRRQRGGAADAAPDRLDGQHPRLHRGREERQGAADGLRPPGLQELRPARQDHQEGLRRRLRGHRRQPAARDRARSWRRSRSRTSTSSSASSTPTSTSTAG